MRRAIGLVVVVGLAVPVSAAETGVSQGGLSPKQVAELRTVEAVVAAPVGSVIAYVLEVPRDLEEEEDGRAWRHLYVLDGEGGPRPFVTGEIRVGAVAWRPDGGAISFLASRGEEPAAVYAIPVDGGEASRIVSHATDIDGYSWGPSGERIAFVATEELDPRTKELRERGFDAEVVEEQLRPGRVWIAEVGGSAAEPRLLPLEGSAREVHWSPAGELLAVKVSPTPLVDDGYVRTRIRILDVESGEVRGRIDNPGKLGEMVWSPDGRQLAVVSAADRHDPAAGRLMVAEASGGELRDLLPGLAGHVVGLAWKSAEEVVFVAQEGVEARLGLVRSDGGGRRDLAAGGPIWEAVALTGDGSAVLLGSTPRHPPEVYRLAGDGGAQRLTDSNPWLGEVLLAEQEVVRYAARDGLELEGLLIRPLEEEAGQRYPLIVVVHGGPEAHYSNGWLTTYSTPGQTGAARGFAVFYPNYRGSTGRGVDFSKLSQGEAAGPEFDDLVDGVDHLVESGLVAAAWVGITGGSYGGYASAWGATYYTDRFAAAVMFVGFAEKISKLGTSDITRELYLVHERKWPWEAWEKDERASPLRYVERAKTPILILHGKEDPRVHPSQSMMLHRYLKLLGRTPVRLVLYPGEGHGNRRAASRYDYSLRQLRWMEHYLQGPGGAPPPPEVDYALALGSEDGDDPGL